MLTRIEVNLAQTVKMTTVSHNSNESTVLKTNSKTGDMDIP